MTSAFENGRKDGQWTREKLRSIGYSSAQKCLEHQEREHLVDLARPSAQDPRHTEYLRGYIAGNRESLAKLIEEEKRK